MGNESSKLVSELAELFELSLGIGTSLDLSKNTETFFSSLVQRKNCTHASVWQRDGDVLNHLEAFPKLQQNESQIDLDSQLNSYLKNLAEGNLELINENIFSITGLNTNPQWLYFSEDIYVILVQNEQDNLFENRQQSQLATLFKKFCVSVKACLSHRASLNEVLKRQAAEYKLFEKESFFRFGANSLNEGIVAVDLEDKITFVNKAMARITGHIRKEMIGAFIKDLFEHVKFKDFVQEILNGKIDINKSDIYEVKLTKNDGTSYWVRITVSAFKNTGGQIVGAIASFLEITETLNAQTIIAESQKELHDLVENMYDALILVSADGTIKNINKAGELLLGYNKNECESLDLSSLVHPEDVQRSLEYVDRLKTEGYYSGYLGRIITKDGSIKEIEVNSTAIVENGKIIGSRDIMRDISVRKDLERRREQSEHKLGLIFDTVLDAMVTMNQEGYIVEWNKNAEQIFGYSAEEVTGNRLSEFIIPEKYREAMREG